MKVCLISDLHFGVKKSDKIFLDSQFRFFREQLIPELNEKKIKNIFILGDVFDTRQSVNVQTENIVLDLFQNDFKDFTVKIIVGNHDIYHTTTNDVNSLKALNLLPNVSVYEKPEEIIIDNKKCLFLPWITDYTQFDELVMNNYDYCFCHADIIGFDMGGGRLSEQGILASNFLDKVNHVYSGHYHKHYSRKYGNQDITYIGSPYQITRIDRNEARGYTIIDFKNDNVEFVENTKSMQFTKHLYPEINKDIITNNVVDIDIPYEYQNDTKIIYDLVQELEKLLPAYPVNLNNLPKETSNDDIELHENDFNLINLFKGYIEQLDTTVNKDELYSSFMELYNMFKDNEK